MKTTLGVLAAALIAAGTMFAQPRVAIGIGAGGYGPGYYPPPAYTQYMPPCPGPDYAWVDGYWVPRGGRNVWIGGYWRSPYVDRKSTRLNSSHLGISYAVFCLKKKKKQKATHTVENRRGDQQKSTHPRKS